jgi:epoxyqueuosine reductase
MTTPTADPHHDNAMLAERIRGWGKELGFQAVGISDIDLAQAETRLADWLQQRFHGEMDYMQRHGLRRSRPGALVPGTVSVISARMDYWPADAAPAEALLDHPDKAYVSRYALGRDYHKLLRARLKSLAKKIEEEIGPRGHRVFVDSAPVLEKPLAEKAGLGWIGKHTNLIDRDAGSWYFLGELYTDIRLPTDVAEHSHCGTIAGCRRRRASRPSRAICLSPRGRTCAPGLRGRSALVRYGRTPRRWFPSSRKSPPVPRCRCPPPLPPDRLRRPPRARRL